jgi:hypothetical protein
VVASSRPGVRCRAGRTGVAALLDARPDLDADPLADRYAVRILRGFGLSKSEAARLASRPLPDITHLA